MRKFDAGSIEANGITIPIQVDDQGNWLAEYDGRTLSYPAREKLENSLKRLTKRAAVVVAVSVVNVEKSYDRARHTRATATGIHGANGNILVTLHKGGRIGDVKEQVSARYGSYGSGLWFGGDVTDEQIAEFSRLIKAHKEAKEAMEAMENRLRIDLFKAVETAVAAVSGTDED
jgi:hypothetical protein